MLNKDMVERMDYDRMYQIYKERFANAADFVFVFCGNIDMDRIRAFCAEIDEHMANIENFQAEAQESSDSLFDTFGGKDGE